MEVARGRDPGQQFARVRRLEDPDGAITHPAVGVYLFGQAQDRLGRTHRGRMAATMSVDHEQVNSVAAHVEHS